MSHLALITIMHLSGCGVHAPCAVSFGNNWFSGRTVVVYDCRHRDRLVELYADGKMIISMANPFVANHNGDFTFFTTKQCIEVDFPLTKQEAHFFSN